MKFLSKFWQKGLFPFLFLWFTRQHSVQMSQTSVHKHIRFLLLLIVASALEALRDHFCDASGYLRLRHCCFLVITYFLTLAGSSPSVNRKGKNNKKL